MSQNPNSINNNELSHKGFGMNSLGMIGNGKQAVGVTSDSPYLGENYQIPAYSFLRQLTDVSPFAFRVVETPVIGGLLAGVSLTHPNVLYSQDGFGTKRENPRTRVRLFKNWRMYVRNNATGAIYMLESDDGINWGLPELLTVAVNYLHGFKPFYDVNGLVTYDDGTGAVTYKYAAICRDSTKTTADATDMYICLSNDGVTWVEVQMADHDVSGDPFGAELAASLGISAVYIARRDESLTFSATLPRTFFGAAGWHAFVRYQTVPGNLGDSVFGCALMGQNSADDLDGHEIGHFANWNRNLLRQVGERSFGQMTRMVPVHIVRFKDVYLALVQLIYAVPGAATLVNMGMGLAISKDGLIFDSCGPLYDAGLVYALNDRSSAVDQTDMDPTSYLANAGVGDGSVIIGGSIVMDPNGLGFGRDCGKDNNRAIMRVYWAEQTANRILIGEL